MANAAREPSAQRLAEALGIFIEVRQECFAQICVGGVPFFNGFSRAVRKAVATAPLDHFGLLDPVSEVFEDEAIVQRTTVNHFLLVKVGLKFSSV